MFLICSIKFEFNDKNVFIYDPRSVFLKIEIEKMWKLAFDFIDCLGIVQIMTVYILQLSC